MSILDTFNTEGSNEEGGSESFILQYGTESVSVGADFEGTLREALAAYADDLGFDQGRAVTFRSGVDVVEGAAKPEAGATYVASVQHEAKG
jgi:hypothetical protein